MILNDLLLLTKIKNGDIEAFKEVFDRYYASLCVYSACIIGDDDEAEEIVQELFYVFWKNKDTLNALRSMKGYLYGAVRNQSIQYLEHKKVEKRYSDRVKSKEGGRIQSLDPQKQMECEELQEIINHTLKKLPERCSRIFNMQRLEGKKYMEIATDLRISVKTVEADMTKTLKILRSEIEIYFQK